MIGPDRSEQGPRRATIVHATTIARCAPLAGWRGVLLQGRSGVGKSDLALRAIAAGWRLVADDRSLVFRSGAGVFARPPDTIAGLIEARGLRVVPSPHLSLAQVILAIECVDQANGLERMEEWDKVDVAGLELRRIRLFAREASAVVKLGLALDVAEGHFDSRFQERI